jgi:hypothetical protein
MKPFYDTTEMIDVDLYADALVSIYRFNHRIAVDSIFPSCIAPERSDAVKTCVLKACLTLVMEVSTITTTYISPERSHSLVTKGPWSTITFFPLPPHFQPNPYASQGQSNIYQEYGYILQLNHKTGSGWSETRSGDQSRSTSYRKTLQHGQFSRPGPNASQYFPPLARRTGIRLPRRLLNGS